MKARFEKITNDHKQALAELLSEPRNNLFNPNPPNFKQGLKIIDEWIADLTTTDIMYQVLILGDKVIGMGGVKIKYFQNYGSFANLYFRVSHLYTKQGLGKMIAIKGIEEAAKHNLRCVGITRKANVPAINLLRSLNFSEISIDSTQIEPSQICFSPMTK
ncbi:MAG: GNAT family N-acetyltransferase [Francisellaceae bacterium]